MQKTQIREAGERAHALARQLADLIVESEVPLPHWDEVLARVAENLEAHAEKDDGDPDPPR